MPFPVAVEIAPADAPREHIAVLLAACTRTKREVECVAAEEVDDRGASAVAIVTWQSEQRALVEVGLRRGGQPEWRTRVLDFEARDDVLERWRTVGIVVGTLANEDLDASAGPRSGSRSTTALSEAPADSASFPEPPPKAEEAPSRRARPQPGEPEPVATEGVPERTGAPSDGPSPSEASAAALDLGAALGPALGRTRSGGFARMRIPVYRALCGIAAFRYFERPATPRDVGARWLTLAFGVGGVVAAPPFELGVSLDGRAEWFTARAEQDDREEAMSRWLAGAALNATLGWMLLDSLGVFAGGEAAYMFGTTALRVQGAPAGEDAAIRYSAELGLRIPLW